MKKKRLLNLDIRKIFLNVQIRLRIVISRSHISVLDLYIHNYFIGIANMNIQKVKSKLDILCAWVEITIDLMEGELAL